MLHPVRDMTIPKFDLLLTTCTGNPGAMPLQAVTAMYPGSKIQFSFMDFPIVAGPLGHFMQSFLTASDWHPLPAPHTMKVVSLQSPPVSRLFRR